MKEHPSEKGQAYANSGGSLRASAHRVLAERAEVT